MRTTRLLFLLLAGTLSAVPAQAGKMIEEPAKEVVEPARTWFPDDPAGNVTLGAQFSEKAVGGYLDSITGLWAPQARDAFLFLNSRYHLEDDGQFISSTGLGFRKLLPERQMIIGGNVFWDAISSARGNDYGQLGLGVEVLTRWVDARFNYYLPDNDHHEIDRHTVRDGETTFGAPFTSGGAVLSNRLETSRARQFKNYEAALEGYNAEVGLLIPGLERYAETRIFAGYYHYDNPFGGDFEGFKARLESHLLPGVIADLEYWDDAALMGGHWTAGVRVSVPFSLYNLATGRNPFAGLGDAFRPRQREFRERLGDMVIRSHRIQTVSSGDRLTRDTSTNKSVPVVLRLVPPTPRPPVTESSLLIE